MYLNYFGFSKEPFKITPDPDFFFAGANRGAVLEALRYAVVRGEGIVKVVGEVGSGKTMLCRMLERELPDPCEVVYLANPRLSPDEILGAVMFELGLSSETDGKLGTMRKLTEKLLEMHGHGRQVIVFIEEAQAMPLETLEEIRLLSNLETSCDKLLQIVLFGQPELDEKLSAHEARQLRERITYTFDLNPLTRTELRDYVESRVRASGYRGAQLFSRGALAQLARYADGLLRRTNVLADKALLAAYADGQQQVKPRHVHRAALDSGYERRGLFAFVRRPWAAATGFAVLMAVAAAGLMHDWDLPAAPGISAKQEGHELSQVENLGEAVVLARTERF